jgi:protein-L-isoaspartate(D-aspartate) O-methyltransferase
MVRIKRCILIYLFISVLFFRAAGGSFADYENERARLIQEGIVQEGIKDEAVIRSMLSVPREMFVPEDLKKLAYLNRPLPIGYGQTISQPYIVALMTELLRVDKDDTVLEVGTGSGYQAAVLAEIVKIVYTIEIIEPLGASAQRRLQELGYSNIKVSIGDGYNGLEEHSPFDAIIVTAAADHIPPPLIRQLKNGGRLCIPVGQPYYPQTLKVLEKDEQGEVTIRDILPVVFVPLTRTKDWKGREWE